MRARVRSSSPRHRAAQTSGWWRSDSAVAAGVLPPNGARRPARTTPRRAPDRSSTPPGVSSATAATQATRRAATCRDRMLDSLQGEHRGPEGGQVEVALRSPRPALGSAVGPGSPPPTHRRPVLAASIGRPRSSRTRQHDLKHGCPLRSNCVRSPVRTVSHPTDNARWSCGSACGWAVGEPGGGVGRDPTRPPSRSSQYGEGRLGIRLDSRSRRPPDRR